MSQLKRAFSSIALVALLATACGLKVDAVIVAGSDAEQGGLTNPVAEGPVTTDGLEPDTTDAVDVGGPTPDDGPDIPDPDAPKAGSIFDSETEGLTKDRITVCTHVPITGAAPIPHHENRFGQFYFDMVNKELGGVYGRDVEFRAIDDRYYPAGARDAMETCRKRGAFIYFGAAGTDQIVSVAKWAENQRVPYFHGPASVKDLDGLNYNVHVGPTYEYQHRLLAQYLVKRFGADKKYASVRVDSPFFEAGVAAFKDELAKLGAQHVLEMAVQKDESQFASLYFELRNKGAEIINNFTTPNIWIKMLPQKPDVYDPWFTAVSPVAGFNIVAAALPSGTKAVIFHHFQPACDCTTYKDEEINTKKDQLPWFDDIKEFLRVFKTYSPEQDPAPDDFDYSSYISAKAVHRILLKLGPDPTRTKLWDLLDSYKEKPAKVFPGCAGDFTRSDDRIGAWRVNIMQLTNNLTWRQVDTCVDKV